MTQEAINNAVVLYRLSVPRDVVEKVDQIFSLTPVLTEALDNPTVPEEEKFSVIDQVFASAALPEKMIHFLKMMCHLHEIQNLHDVFEAFYRYWDVKKKIIRAELVSVTKATDAETKEATETLQEMYPDHQIVLTNREDENILGGYIIRMFHQEIDRSYEGRLRQIERKFTRR